MDEKIQSVHSERMFVSQEAQEMEKGNSLEAIRELFQDENILRIPNLKNMWESVSSDNEEAVLLVRDILTKSLEYTNARASLAVVVRTGYSSPEAYRRNVAEHDERRRRKHDLLIDSLNILSRWQQKNEQDNSWRDAFSSREYIGEWAQMLSINIDAYHTKRKEKQNNE